MWFTIAGEIRGIEPIALGPLGARAASVSQGACIVASVRTGAKWSCRDPFVLTRIDGVGLVAAMVVDCDWNVVIDRASHHIGQNVAQALIRQRQRRAAGIRSPDDAPLPRGR
jgi:hypothetical protein